MSESLAKFKEALFASKAQAGDSSQGDGPTKPKAESKSANKRGAGAKKQQSNSTKAALLEAANKDAAAKTAAARKPTKSTRPSKPTSAEAAALKELKLAALKKAPTAPSTTPPAEATRKDTPAPTGPRLLDSTAPRNLTSWHRNIIKEIVRDSDYAIAFDNILDKLCDRDEGVSGRFSQALVQDALQSLETAGIVVQQGSRYAYRSLDGLVNKDTILQHLRRKPNGTVLQHIQHEYKGLLADVERLREEGKIYKIHHTEQKYDVLFAATKTALPSIRMDRDLVEFWHEVEVLDPVKRQESLMKANMKCFAALQNEKREPLAVVQKAKKKRQYRPRNVTNTHLLGTALFSGEQATGID